MCSLQNTLLYFLNLRKICRYWLPFLKCCNSLYFLSFKNLLIFLFHLLLKELFLYVLNLGLWLKNEIKTNVRD